MAQHHHAHPSEVPSGQRAAAALTHLGGMLFLFIPSAFVWFQTRRDPKDSWLAHQAKEALNFQLTVTALICVCAMLSWTLSPIGVRMVPLVIGFNWLFSIIAVFRSFRGDKHDYPFKFSFIR